MHYDYLKKSFVASLDINYGSYQYKFTVNDIWMYDITKPIITDNDGNINNLIIVEPENIINIVHISDTHSIYNADLSGDILIHSGDFSIGGHPNEYEMFNNWLGNLNFKYKVVVLGNHDLDYFNDNGIDPYLKANELLTNAIVLNFTNIELCGIKFYGNPWYLAHNWNNTYKQNSSPILFEYKIPSDIDILITHSPPFLFCDDYAGSKILLKNIEQTQPKAHLFGHIHQKYGYAKHTWSSNNTTYFINSSMVTQDSKIICNTPHYIKYDILTKSIISVN